MGAINYGTSEYITIGLKPYNHDDYREEENDEVDYDQMNFDYDCDKENVEYILDKYNFNFALLPLPLYSRLNASRIA